MPVERSTQTPAMQGAKVHFRGLNGIRAIAAMIVVVAHTGQYLPMFGLPAGEYYQWHWQSYGVTLFFVLSGYLITFLLLEEKSRTGTVALKSFYLRRMLRIWPLYYLILILALLLPWLWSAFGKPLPPLPVFCYTFLLANVAMHLNLPPTPLGPLWSIGVEEQFYALWPVMIKKSSSALRMLLLVIGGYLAVKAAVFPLKNEFVSALVAETRIDCMAIGGVGAVILRQNGKLLRLLYSRAAQGFCWLLFLYSTLYRPVHVRSFIDHELYAVTFMILIVNVSTNKETLVNLENGLFDFFGKISYGLYIYHMMVIFCLSAAVKSLVTPTWQSYLLVYAGVLIGTTLIAHLSFIYFETPFLKLKDRFSVVKSQASRSEESTPAGDVAVAEAGSSWE